MPYVSIFDGFISIIWIILNWIILESMKVADLLIYRYDPDQSIVCVKLEHKEFYLMLVNILQI